MTFDLDAAVALSYVALTVAGILVMSCLFHWAPIAVED
jgi:hypothetical protein